MKKKTKNHRFTLLFIPGDSGKTVSVHINKYLIWAAVFCIVVFTAGLAALLLKTGEIALKLQLINSLRHENEQLRDDNRKLLLAVRKVENIEVLSQYLRRIATLTDESIIPAPTAPSEKVAGPSLLDDNTDRELEVERFGLSAAYKDLALANAPPEQIMAAVPNIQPVEGWVTKGFMVEDTILGRSHPGVDFAAAEGSLIRAAAPGIIDAVINDKYFGLMVTVKHSFDFATRYGHCSQILVSEGDHVERGQAIALVGNTGRSSGPHLHFEVLKGEEPVDPMKYIVGTSAPM